MNSLLVIDDTKIWRAVFSKVNKVLLSIDRLEEQVTAFADEQRQFNEWCETRFHTQRQSIAAGRDQLAKLHRFQQWAIALGKMEDRSYPSAYVAIRDEEMEYARGNSAERERIEALRAKRDEFTERELRARREARQSEAAHRAKEAAVNEDQELRLLGAMSDQSLRELLDDPEFASQILITILTQAQDEADWELFVRIWDIAPETSRPEMNHRFLKIAKHDLTDFVAKLRERLNNPPGGSPDGGPLETGDDAATARGLDAEALKHAYRRLVRLIHPDRQTDGGKLDVWRAKLWHRGQNAYRREDRADLDNLFILYNLRAKNFGELTLNEVDRSHRWLSGELKRVRLEALSLKRSPAWGFSRIKSLETIERKLSQEFLRERHDIDAEIWEIERDHSAYRRLVRIEQRDDSRTLRSGRNRPRDKR